MAILILRWLLVILLSLTLSVIIAIASVQLLNISEPLAGILFFLLTVAMIYPVNKYFVDF